MNRLSSFLRVAALAGAAGLGSVAAQPGGAPCSPQADVWLCPDDFTVVYSAQDTRPGIPSGAPRNTYRYAADPGYSGGTNTALSRYEGNRAAGYQYATYLADTNTTGSIQRPLIFVDGIDVGGGFGNARSADAIVNRLLNRPAGDGQPEVRLADQLLASGYDLVVLDYEDALDFIQRNGLAVVDLVERINAELGPGHQIEAIVGPSMGALVVRYALLELEDRGIDHRIPVYVSFDGAHQGGHIPVGIQQTLDDLVHHTEVNLYAPDAAYIDLADAIVRSPSVRQLLVVNAFAGDYQTSPEAVFSSDPLRVRLMNQIASLGDYPEAPRNLAIVNGAADGRAQRVAEGAARRVAPGEEIFSVDASINLFFEGFRAELRSFAGPVGSTPGPVFRRVDSTCDGFCNGSNWVPTPHGDVGPWVITDRGAPDSAPGGYRTTAADLADPFNRRPTFEDAIDLLSSFDLGSLVEPLLYVLFHQVDQSAVQLAVQAPVDNHAFVTTLSALDYNTTGASRASLLGSLFQNQDPFRSIATDRQQGVADARTPFDAFYIAGDASGESPENQAHIALTPGIADWVLGELQGAPQDLVFSSSTTLPSLTLGPNSTVTVATGRTLTVTGAATVGAGTRFRLGQGATVRFQGDGSRLDGRAGQRITVEPLAPGDQWGSIRIEGDGSSLSHVQASGGRFGIYVYRADGVSIQDSQVSGGMTGMVVSRGSVSTLARTRISSNYGHGLVVSFDASADLSAGGNRILGNGVHEVYLTAETARATLTAPAHLGNVVADASNQGYLVYNQARHPYIIASEKRSDGWPQQGPRWTLPAERVWWGNAAGPASTQLSGPVDWQPQLTTDPDRRIVLSDKRAMPEPSADALTEADMGPMGEIATWLADGRPEAALEATDRVLAHGASVDLHLARAYALADLGRDAEALDALDAAQALAGDASPDLEILRADLGQASAPSESSEALLVGAPRPNPTAGTVTLDLATQHGGEVRLEAFDALGRQVQTTTVRVSAGSQPVSLDLGSVPPGLYMVRLTVDDGGRTRSAVRRVVVTR